MLQTETKSVLDRREDEDIDEELSAPGAKVRLTSSVNW